MKIYLYMYAYMYVFHACRSYNAYVSTYEDRGPGEWRGRSEFSSSRIPKVDYFFIRQAAFVKLDVEHDGRPA